MRFHRFGLSFEYPDNWTVDTDDSLERFAAVTVYSPEGGFWSLSGHAPGGDPADLSQAVLEQMREDYRDLDSESAESMVHGHLLEGLDINFSCLDFTNTAHVRTLETPSAVYLLVCQAEDRDWERIAPVFEAMTASFVTSLPEASVEGD